MFIAAILVGPIERPSAGQNLAGTNAVSNQAVVATPSYPTVSQHSPLLLAQEFRAYQPPPVSAAPPIVPIAPVGSEYKIQSFEAYKAPPVSISTPPPLAEMPHVHAHPHHADAETPSLCDVLTDPEARHRAGCP